MIGFSPVPGRALDRHIDLAARGDAHAIAAALPARVPGYERSRVASAISACGNVCEGAR